MHLICRNIYDPLSDSDPCRLEITHEFTDLPINSTNLQEIDIITDLEIYDDEEKLISLLIKYGTEPGNLYISNQSVDLRIPKIAHHVKQFDIFFQKWYMGDVRMLSSVNTSSLAIRSCINSMNDAFPRCLIVISSGFTDSDTVRLFIQNVLPDDNDLSFIAIGMN